MAVGEILGSYDTDNMYPVRISDISFMRSLIHFLPFSKKKKKKAYGFGAKIGNQVSHCFALGGDPTRVCCC